MDFCAKGLKTRLNALQNVLEDAFCTSTSAVSAVFDVSPDPALNSQEDSWSQACARAEFEFNSAPAFFRSEPQPKSI